MTTKETGRPFDAAAPNASQSDSGLDPVAEHKSSNSAAAQRARTLEALGSGPKSTIELRRNWDILSPAPRIKELRERGYPILTNWVQHATDCGKLHRVAHYVLHSETPIDPAAYTRCIPRPQAPAEAVQ
ncbi:MAG: helix-turn-helix domain-containing protein [Gammaproteobacteria bacterium]